MADASILLSFDLLFVAALMRKVESGEESLSSNQAGTIAETLDKIAQRCAAIDEERASLEQQVAVMRRWFTKRDFGEEFARLEAIRAGVRAGGVIDLVTVFERERALAATSHGGAA
ncbi:hypothetical protein IY145_10890 [Methylosinus sp. H3A]|uniref:hypothetical protein n=1 Tax=Methylosinus sp. H3A TaxID=2785786 RepID=UPI0018C1EED0|nr:hypothetical protein [Methylosinus sp. H3A]MBG0809885.1 hypothetical protein [Methylosinus sp. H3A]